MARRERSDLHDILYLLLPNSTVVPVGFRDKVSKDCPSVEKEMKSYVGTGKR